MNNDATNQYTTENSARAAAMRRRKVFFTYLIFGPPIGGFITVSSLILYWIYDFGIVNLWSEPKFMGAAEIILFPLWALMYSLLGYIFGGVQAALTGVIIACLASKEGKFGYGPAFAAPVLVGLVAGIVLAYPLNADVQLSAFLGVIGVLASLAIRVLFRKKFRREDLDHVEISVPSA